MCQKMPPKSAKLRHYSLSRQNSVKFWKDFTPDRIFFTPTLLACWYVFAFLQVCRQYKYGVWHYKCVDFLGSRLRIGGEKVWCCCYHNTTVRHAMHCSRCVLCHNFRVDQIGGLLSFNSLLKQSLFLKRYIYFADKPSTIEQQRYIL